MASRLLQNAPKGQSRRRTLSLPRMAGWAAARRSITAAGTAASSMASNVSAAASAAASGASNIVSSVTAGAATASQELSSFVSFAMTKRPYRPARLPALEHRPTVSLPRLSLEGSEASRPTMSLHNVGLMRWIFEEAKSRHLARPSYQARQHDETREKLMAGVIFREVCADIRSATRNCCAAYRAVKILNTGARQKAEARERVACNIRAVRRKLLVAGLLCKMLQEVRENNARAELMWKDCRTGLGSWSLSGAVFGCRSLGLPSFPRSYVCGSITLGLRKGKNKTRSISYDDLDVA